MVSSLKTPRDYRERADDAASLHAEIRRLRALAGSITDLDDLEVILNQIHELRRRVGGRTNAGGQETS